MRTIVAYLLMIAPAGVFAYAEHRLRSEAREGRSFRFYPLMYRSRDDFTRDGQFWLSVARWAFVFLVVLFFVASAMLHSGRPDAAVAL